MPWPRRAGSDPHVLDLGDGRVLPTDPSAPDRAVIGAHDEEGSGGWTEVLRAETQRSTDVPATGNTNGQLSSRHHIPSPASEAPQ